MQPRLLKTARQVLAGILVMFVSATFAEAGETAGRIPGPALILPKDAKSCVRDTDFMRRNHMEMLLHKRDATMHDGIRTKEDSLQNCINCHATKDKAGKYISVNAPGQFCSSCHEYASVKIDCFECHRSTPEKTSKAAMQTKSSGHAWLFADKNGSGKKLRAYLDEAKK